MYDRASKTAMALETANTVILPLLGASQRIRRVGEVAVGKNYRVVVQSTRDKRVNIVVLELPAANPLVIALYSSAQTSRPVAPSQLLKRLKRLVREVSKLRGRMFAEGDILYVYVAPGGLTSGSRRLARREGVIAVRTGVEARRRLAKYLAKRYKKLLEKVLTRRIWGELPLLAYALSILARKLSGKTGREEFDIMFVERAVKSGCKGFELFEVLGPPPENFA